MKGIPGFGENAEAARSTHELFMAYVDAGFSRQEALAIIIGMLGSMASAAATQGKR